MGPLPVGSPWLGVVKNGAVTTSAIRHDLRRVEDLLLRRAGASANPLVSEASTHLIKAGGKRVRPAVVLLGSNAGVPGRAESDLAAAAVELLHLASLYHDDVIDETEIRRGVPTAQAKWGTTVAILAGDFLFASGCALGAEAGGEVPLLLARAITEVCEGQISETESLGDPRRRPDEYLNTIKLKTATLLRVAGELAASTSGATRERRAALTGYGENFGIAFQLVDDLLDFVGDPEVTGKTPGTDLKKGVFTLPVLIGAQRDADLSGLLREGERELKSVLPRLESSGALEASIDVAESYAKRAFENLGVLPDSDWRDALSGLVEGVLDQLS